MTGLAELGTATLSDALDRLGLPGSAAGIAPLGVGQRMAGPAFTVRYVPVGAEPGTVGDYVDDCVPGDVVVLDNYGRSDCTVWGEILTAVATDRGIAGTAINGVCRDVREALQSGYPIYSRGRFMRTGKDRVEVADVGGTVVLGDVAVRAGDYVVGDDDGLVVIPRERLDEVAELAATIAAKEQAIVAAARGGRSLAASRSEFGYHTLQRDEGTP